MTANSFTIYTTTPRDILTAVPDCNPVNQLANRSKQIILDWLLTKFGFVIIDRYSVHNDYLIATSAVNCGGSVVSAMQIVSTCERTII